MQYDFIYQEDHFEPDWDSLLRVLSFELAYSAYSELFSTCSVVSGALLSSLLAAVSPLLLISYIKKRNY